MIVTILKLILHGFIIKIPKYLKLLMVIFEISIILKFLECYLLITGKILDYTWYFRFPDSLIFLLGVIPYLYVKIYFRENQSLRKKDLIHFLWIIPSIFLNTPFLSNDKSIAIDMYYVGILNDTTRYLATVFLLVCFIYCLRSIKRILKYETEVEEYSSNIEELRLSWMKGILTFLMLVYLTISTLILSNFSFLHPLDYSLYISTSYLLFTSLLTFISLKRIRPLISIQKLTKIKIEKTQNNAIMTEEKLSHYAQKLKSYIETDKPFLRIDLKLSDLSAALDIPQYLISNTINNHFNKSFNELINDYRIEEFKNNVLKSENKNITILALAYEAGFNSKSNFNKQFKLREKTTPKDYRDLKLKALE